MARASLDPPFRAFDPRQASEHTARKFDLAPYLAYVASLPSGGPASG